LDDADLDEDLLAQTPTLAKAIHAYSAFGPRQLAISPAFRAGIAPQVAQSDVVHVHGIWSRPCHTVAKLALKYGVPYVVTPHGMLDAWALRHRQWRKRLARLLVERKFLEQASCLQALAPAEYDDIRRFGCARPVAIVPNGINLAEFDRLVPGDVVCDRWPELKQRRVVLFLSRIHPKKGLPILLQAWAGLASRHADWLLVIAGPNENGHQGTLHHMTHGLAITKHVLYTGPIYGEEKLALLQLAELFVLPSHSEGFSMAVLEAMACGVPVVITPHCNFPEVEHRGAGRIVNTGVAGLIKGLRELMDCGPAVRAQIGRRARRLVEQSYTWYRVTRQMDAVYRWMIDGGSPPECVVFD
jgi:poly(glycerol-phosphate) alpha-glucosyltransferase